MKDQEARNDIARIWNEFAKFVYPKHCPKCGHLTANVLKDYTRICLNCGTKFTRTTEQWVEEKDECDKAQ